MRAAAKARGRGEAPATMSAPAFAEEMPMQGPVDDPEQATAQPLAAPSA